MTRFTFRGDVTWGAGNGPRSVEVMTENQEGFDAWCVKAKDAVRDSSKLLDKALEALRGRLSRDVIRYAHRYFLTDARGPSRDEVAIIRSTLVLIRNGLNQQVVTLKLDSVQVHRGFVNAHYNNLKMTKPYHNMVHERGANAQARMGAIHVAGARMEQGRLGVKTLIHEASHKFAGTEDYCYFRDDGETPRSEFTDRHRALQNADSYAWFTLKVGRGNWIEARHGFRNNMLSG